MVVSILIYYIESYFQPAADSRSLEPVEERRKSRDIIYGR